MRLALTRQTFERSFASRTVTERDKEDLAILLYAAFRGTVDDEGETFVDALAEIEKTFAGDYGRLLSDCSFVVKDGEFLSAACLITWFDLHDAPLVAFSMTRPGAQRKGMARFLLKKSINALFDEGYERLTLIVTRENEPAFQLYDSLGFRPIEDA
jgi:ribosomal protein S18 acetylase RimI-like enzyme